MKIYLREITDQQSEFDFNEDEQWVVEAVSKLDETDTHPKRSVDAHFCVQLVDDVVLVNGQVRTQIQLLCSRCGVAYLQECRPSFSSLFCQDPDTAGISHLLESGKPAGQLQGKARHAHDTDPKDIDISYLKGDCIDLGEVLLEQLRLQIPLQPLCKEDCRGVCTQCGVDRNSVSCSCTQDVSSNPFAVLKNFEVNH